MKSSLRFFAALAPLLLAACAPQQLVRNKGDAASLAQQQLREQQLVTAKHWTLQGRLSVSSDRDSGGTGNLTWIQDGEHYEFTIRTPITGRSFRLVGGPHGAVLEGLDGGPRQGPDAETLMQRALGWEVPLSDLRAWVLGMRATGSSAELSFGDDKLPSLLQQDGWSVTYPAWDTTRQPPLPTKVFAEKPPYKVRLAIESWSMQ